jgi:hypothetical protein
MKAITDRTREDLELTVQELSHAMQKYVKWASDDLIAGKYGNPARLRDQILDDARTTLEDCGCTPRFAMPHIIIAGNPVDGFEYIGPFSNGAAAFNYINTDPHLPDGDVWTARLDVPAP